MLVAYDGGGYRGFAANPGVATVAGDIEEALAKIAGQSITLTCAGRTDAGVHATGQVVSFDCPTLDIEKVQHSLNKLCAPAIAVRELQVAANDFDARHSATSRRYHYRVLNSAVPDPLLRHTTWRVTHPVDLAAMQQAAQHFVAEQDFSSFCRKRLVGTPDGEVEASLTREVTHLRVELDGDDVLRVSIEASAFCQQMVRSITGTLVDVGLGKFAPDDVVAMLAARDRNAAGQVAPPQGLTLVHVGYGE